jgi:protein gp37
MTEISWTDKTWNPLVGCSKKSAGCQNCYAIQQAYRNEAIGKTMENPGRLAYYEGLAEKRGSRIEWAGKVNFVPEALEIPLKRKKPTKWFCQLDERPVSMSLCRMNGLTRFLR